LPLHQELRRSRDLNARHHTRERHDCVPITGRSVTSLWVMARPLGRGCSCRALELLQDTDGLRSTADFNGMLIWSRSPRLIVLRVLTLRLNPGARIYTEYVPGSRSRASEYPSLLGMSLTVVPVPVLRMVIAAAAIDAPCASERLP
jgi:hypothetical protein